jgi:hypothetical protein
MQAFKLLKLNDALCQKINKLGHEYLDYVHHRISLYSSSMAIGAKSIGI